MCKQRAETEPAHAWAVFSPPPLLGSSNSALVEGPLKEGTVAALYRRLQLTLHIPCKPHATQVEARCLTPVTAAACLLPSLHAHRCHQPI